MCVVLTLSGHILVHQAKRVETVRQTCDMYADDQRREIMNRFEKRMNTMQQNKSTQLKKLQERLSDHVSIALQFAT